MNSNKKNLDMFLNDKEKLLMEECRKSKYIISENDVLSKHYSFIDSEIELFNDYIVSTQWRVKGTMRCRFDLVIVKKWEKTYKYTKDCFDNNYPCYAVEYKIDDAHGTYGKGHQHNDFKDDVIRLSEHCDYMDRAFALYYYRGPIDFKGNVFDSSSQKYLFRDCSKIKNKEKLNIYFVDRFTIHKLDLY